MRGPRSFAPLSINYLPFTRKFPLILCSLCLCADQRGCRPTNGRMSDAFACAPRRTSCHICSGADLSRAPLSDTNETSFNDSHIVLQSCLRQADFFLRFHGRRFAPDRAHRTCAPRQCICRLFRWPDSARENSHYYLSADDDDAPICFS